MTLAILAMLPRDQTHVLPSATCQPAVRPLEVILFSDQVDAIKYARLTWLMHPITEQSIRSRYRAAPMIGCSVF